MTAESKTTALVICRGATHAGRVGFEAAGRGGLEGWAEVVIIDEAIERDADRWADPAPSDSGWSELTADFLLFLPADCLLGPQAFDVIDDLIRHNPEVDFAYFDSTGYSTSDPARLVEPCHRPGFSPERLRAQMYLGQAFLVSRTVAQSVARTTAGSGRTVTAPLTLFAPLTHGAALALTGASAAVAHVPQVLYRFPVGPGGDPGSPIPDEQSATSMAEHQGRLDHGGFPARALPSAHRPGVIRLEPELTVTPTVSIVMPTNGSQRMIEGRPTVLCLQAIESVVAKSTYPHYELVLVITPGAPPDLAAQVISTIDAHPPGRQPTIRLCRDDRRFNFSNACNRGAVTATGDFLVFLNDDTMVESPDWLERLVMYGSRPDVGAVGARLHYGGGGIQHAGIWARGGHPSHRYERFPVDHPGYLDSLAVPQNCLAVTGACLAVEADKFRRAGGFSPEFPSSYNDVDLCLKLDDLGYRTVVDPDAVLTHFEASSRDPKIDDWELALLHERWRSVITTDPYDNPHHLAPGSEEWPAPDPMVTEKKRLAGWIDYLPRIWPRARLTVDPRVDHPSGQNRDRSERAASPC